MKARAKPASPWTARTISLAPEVYLILAFLCFLTALFIEEHDIDFDGWF